MKYNLFLVLFCIWQIQSTVILVDPDTINAISFPSQRISFVDGRVVPEDLHIVCGWWNRKDSPICTYQHKDINDWSLCDVSCEFIHATYGEERNMTCYSNNEQLKLSSTVIVCEERLVNGTEVRPWVEQDSCSILIDEIPVEKTLKWNPLVKTIGGGNLKYNEVLNRYGSYLKEHQIVNGRNSWRISYCRFNTTDVIKTIHGGWNTTITFYRTLRRIANQRPAIADMWHDLSREDKPFLCKSIIDCEKDVIYAHYAYFAFTTWNFMMFFIGLMIDIGMIVGFLLLIYVLYRILPFIYIYFIFCGFFVFCCSDFFLHFLQIESLADMFTVLH